MDKEMRRGSTRVKEEWEKYESPCGQVDGNSNPHYRGFGENQSYSTLKIRQTYSSQKRNWSDSSGNSPTKTLASRCALST